MIPYGRQKIDADDIKAVTKVLRSDNLTQGPAILDFEMKLADSQGTRYAVAVANGTAALHASYLAAGLQAGDEVITTPNTFVATTNMLLAVGAQPVFCDIRLDTYNIDEQAIEKLITPKTRAIVPVHFAGQPAAIKLINSIAQKHKLLVIADACHALGATYNEKLIGQLADMSVFSFHPVKQITTGEGGAILTDSKAFYEKLLLTRSHGVTKDKNGFNVMTEMGYNYRLTDIQAALGSSQLKKLAVFSAKRRAVAALYHKLLKDNPHIVLPQELPGNTSAWHLYVIRVKDPRTRLPLYNFLKKNSVGVNFHYPAVYSHPYYRANGFKNTALPNADLYSATAITLPIHTQLSKEDTVYIATLINTFFKIHD